MTQPERSTEQSDACVLLVEDDILVRSLIAEVLRDDGMAVIEASNADEAWTYIESGGQVDVVFSDVRMPGSMDGIELARRIKHRYPQLGIVLTSGYVGEKHAQEATFHLVKPYMPSTAVARIRDALKLLPR